MPSLLPFRVAAHASGLCTRGRPGRKAKPSGRAARGLDSPAFFPSGPGPPSPLAVSAKDEEGQPITRWHRCVDWEGLTATYRKGDRVALTGFFKTRTYEKDGEPKQVREFVVTGAKLEKMKVREQAA